MSIAAALECQLGAALYAEKNGPPLDPLDTYVAGWWDGRRAALEERNQSDIEADIEALRKRYGERHAHNRRLEPGAIHPARRKGDYPETFDAHLEAVARRKERRAERERRAADKPTTAEVKD